MRCSTPRALLICAVLGLAALSGCSGHRKRCRCRFEHRQDLGRSARNRRALGGDFGLSREASFGEVRTGVPCSSTPAARNANDD